MSQKLKECIIKLLSDENPPFDVKQTINEALEGYIENEFEMLCNSHDVAQHFVGINFYKYHRVLEKLDPTSESYSEQLRLVLKGDSRNTIPCVRGTIRSILQNPPSKSSDIQYIKQQLSTSDVVCTDNGYPGLYQIYTNDEIWAVIENERGSWITVKEFFRRMSFDTLLKYAKKISVRTHQKRCGPAYVLEQFCYAYKNLIEKTAKNPNDSIERHIDEIKEIRKILLDIWDSDQQFKLLSCLDRDAIKACVPKFKQPTKDILLCKYCGRATTTQSGLTLHIKRYHNV